MVSFLSGLSFFSMAAESSGSEGLMASWAVLDAVVDLAVSAETEESDFWEGEVGGGGGGVRAFGCCCGCVVGRGNGLVSGVRVSVLTVRYWPREDEDFH